MTKLGFWLSDTSTPSAEIVAEAGYDFVVLDVEHGMFDLEALDRFIPLVKALGLQVFAKVRETSAAAIQQPLDFGADGVIVPHVTTAEHAESLARFATYPPRGERSVAGGRIFSYGPSTDERLEELNAETLFFPLIEHPLAVRDIELTADLENVHGLMIGPGDLSLTSGRGEFAGTEADWADINGCVDAMQQRGKAWMYPAWTDEELTWALERGADYVIVGAQYYAYRSAVVDIKARADAVFGSRQGRP